MRGRRPWYGLMPARLDNHGMRPPVSQTAPGQRLESQAPRHASQHVFTNVPSRSQAQASERTPSQLALEEMERLNDFCRESSERFRRTGSYYEHPPRDPQLTLPPIRNVGGIFQTPGSTITYDLQRVRENGPLFREQFRDTSTTPSTVEHDLQRPRDNRPLSSGPPIPPRPVGSGRQQPRPLEVPAREPARIHPRILQERQAALVDPRARNPRGQQHLFRPGYFRPISYNSARDEILGHPFRDGDRRQLAPAPARNPVLPSASPNPEQPPLATKDPALPETPERKRKNARNPAAKPRKRKSLAEPTLPTRDETLPPQPPAIDPDTLPQSITSDYSRYKWSVLLLQVDAPSTGGPAKTAYDTLQHFLSFEQTRRTFEWHVHVTEGFIARGGNQSSFVVAYNACNPFSDKDLFNTTSFGYYHGADEDSIQWLTVSFGAQLEIIDMLKNGVREAYRWRVSMRADEKRFHRAYWLAANMLPLGALLNRAAISPPAMTTATNKEVREKANTETTPSATGVEDLSDEEVPENTGIDVTINTARRNWRNVEEQAMRYHSGLPTLLNHVVGGSEL
ncbi:hypothetical protein BU24DRAFT_455247 [Aaosphaeria arxii CBS 175.79]|uniref:Uncharacterized protein n=1 Tax=Aaosphaeria arxii CBS 175.79 TaxID=1450172 RepID=A0A6A5XB19_9PLEO|nr:uncharacterized protein BU24DRAFT_455247 [Aaosphaeria arxii CBS 175.79]KAF2010093.1 hypothetical protein BU24DRAFT_455247 [Aaosphaeria arxii CBS 175.79]